MVVSLRLPPPLLQLLQEVLSHLQGGSEDDHHGMMKHPVPVSVEFRTEINSSTLHGLWRCLSPPCLPATAA